jgi:SAM-dependent methyltransferase
VSRPALINLGCGHRYHPAWTNVDLVPAGPGVLRMDIGKPLPFPDGAFDAVYHSNVLEHIRRPQVATFMTECARICRRGGILRVAVPDLEAICRLYLDRLASCLRGEPQAEAEYEWMLLELLDQMVREESGGEMGAYLRRTPLPAEEFVYGRIGNEGREYVAHQRRHEAAAAAKPARPWKALRRRILALLRPRPSVATRIGGFRLAGEVHQWMYDRHSLARLMAQAGFPNARVVSPLESGIPGWNEHHLEVAADGSVNKPDSLVMEAIKA